MILKFKKGHKKAFAISILNLYSLALLWIVSAVISFNFVFTSYEQLAYFAIGSLFCPLFAVFLHNRNPVNLYLVVRDILMSKIMIFIVIMLLVILNFGVRGDDGTDHKEVASIIFSSLSILFTITFLFKSAHGDKWYDSKLKNDDSHFSD